MDDATIREWREDATNAHHLMYPKRVIALCDEVDRLRRVERSADTFMRAAAAVKQCIDGDLADLKALWDAATNAEDALRAALAHLPHAERRCCRSTSVVTLSAQRRNSPRITQRRKARRERT